MTAKLLDMAFSGDSEGITCRVEFVGLRPDPIRFAWACMCHERSWTPLSFEDALASMREHKRDCEL